MIETAHALPHQRGQFASVRKTLAKPLIERAIQELETRLVLLGELRSQTGEQGLQGLPWPAVVVRQTGLWMGAVLSLVDQCSCERCHSRVAVALDYETGAREREPMLEGWVGGAAGSGVVEALLGVGEVVVGCVECVEEGQDAAALLVEEDGGDELHTFADLFDFTGCSFDCRDDALRLIGIDQDVVQDLNGQRDIKDSHVAVQIRQNFLGFVC